MQCILGNYTVRRSLQVLKAVQPLALATFRQQAAQRCALIRFRSLLGISAFVVAYSTVAETGPPMEIDDTGILEPGQREYILAIESVETSAGTSWALAVIDASLGLTGSTQLSIAVVQSVSDRANLMLELFGNSDLLRWPGQLGIQLGVDYMLGRFKLSFVGVVGVGRGVICAPGGIFRIKSLPRCTVVPLGIPEFVQTTRANAGHFGRCE